LGDKATNSGSDVGDSDLNDEGGFDDEDVATDEGLGTNGGDKGGVGEIDVARRSMNS